MRLRRSVSVVVLAVVASIGLSACDRANEAVDEAVDEVARDEEFASARELVEALAEGGVECRGLEAAAVGGAEVGVCRIGREPVSVGIYGDNEAMQQDIEVRRDAEEAFLMGGNWVLIARSTETAAAAREAIGGELSG